MADTAALLAAYDAQMRMPPDAAPPGVTYEHDGPVVRIVGGHVGRIRAPRDVGVTGAQLDRLIARQQDRFRARGQGVEWKVRAHDLPADLPERLVAAGFVPEEPSTVLLGGTTLPEWRGRGLCRAMIAARAGEAAARGVRLLHVDASPASAPILRRCGFQEITTSRHYQWTPPEGPEKFSGHDVGSGTERS